MTPLELLEPFTQHDASLSVVVPQGPVVTRLLRDRFDRALPTQLDAEVLVVTALTHCAGEGSINQIAARLHRHRNTAFHRPESCVTSRATKGAVPWRWLGSCPLSGSPLVSTTHSPPTESARPAPR
jgi:hypothetical protein